jgi:hypothetical protein
VSPTACMLVWWLFRFGRHLIMMQPEGAVPCAWLAVPTYVGLCCAPDHPGGQGVGIRCNSAS